ncbi:unnamed protein product [Ixodes pacificus]
MITASNITNSSAFLTWTSGFVLPEQKRVPLKLSGYFLTGMSLGHTFQKILEPTLTEYNLSCLKPWTEYNITLRRFYPNNGNTDRPMRIGRAAAVTLRTYAYTPLAPSEIQITSAGQEELNLRIVDPISWNGLPLKYHVRWEPEDPRSGVSGNIELDIPSTRPYDPDGMNVTLSLEPGVRYRLYVTAENSAEGHNVTFLGPEIFRVVATIPKDPIGLIVNSLSSGELFVSWSVSGPADFFRVNVTSYYENPGFGRSLEPDMLRKMPTQSIAYGKLALARSFIKASAGLTDVNLAATKRNLINHLSHAFGASCYVGICIGSSVAPVLCDIYLSAMDKRISGALDGMNVVKIFRYVDDFLVILGECTANCMEHDVEEIVNLFSCKHRLPVSFDQQVERLTRAGYPKSLVTSVCERLLQNIKREGIDKSREKTDKMPVQVILYLHKLSHNLKKMAVTKTKENIWTNCTDDAHCDVAVIHGWTPEFKTGFITLKNLVPYTTYSVSIRGCNDAGCGNNSTLKVRTGIAAKAESVGWMGRNQGGILVKWERPSVPAGPLRSYIVSWECPKNEKQTKTVGECRLLVEDLPEEGSNCTFWVAGLNRSPEGHLLVGTAANVTLS